MVFARYVGVLRPGGRRRACASSPIGAVVVLSAVNYLGVRQGSRRADDVHDRKVAAIVADHRRRFAAGPAPAAGRFDSRRRRAPRRSPFSEFPLAVVAGLFAFGGWHMVTYAAEETREPERTIPRALLVGDADRDGCYIALKPRTCHVLPLDKIAARRASRPTRPTRCSGAAARR